MPLLRIYYVWQVSSICVIIHCAKVYRKPRVNHAKLWNHNWNRWPFGVKSGINHNSIHKLVKFIAQDLPLITGGNCTACPWHCNMSRKVNGQGMAVECVDCWKIYLKKSRHDCFWVCFDSWFELQKCVLAFLILHVLIAIYTSPYWAESMWSKRDGQLWGYADFTHLSRLRNSVRGRLGAALIVVHTPFVI